MEINEKVKDFEGVCTLTGKIQNEIPVTVSPSQRSGVFNLVMKDILETYDKVDNYDVNLKIKVRHIDGSNDISVDINGQVSIIGKRGKVTEIGGM
jgi:hypothetical protein